MKQLLFFISLTAMISGCTGLGKIAENQYLVTEYKINLEKKENIRQYKKVHRTLTDEITKDPNGKFLWMRPKLAIYNTFSEPKKQKGIKYWLKYKLGKPPVLLDELYCDRLNETFENRLYHQGYFNARSSFLITKKPKTADVVFDIEAGKPYIIDTLIWPEPDDTLSMAINSTSSNTLIRQEAIYNLNTLKDERMRIDDELKNMGFYYFNPDFILFQADTSAGEHHVILKLAIKEDAPQEGRKVFTIDKIYVAEDYRLDNYHPDTLQTGDYTVISASGYMKPKYFLNSILYSQDSTYSKQRHNNSIRQLMGLQTYKFVNARYTPSARSANMLDVSYMMTPARRMSASAELNAVNKSNNFAGPGIKLSYSSKNFLRGAELFSINLNGRFEKQLSGEGEGDTAYEIGADANLDIPRLIPLKLRKRNIPYMPTSGVSLGFGRFARVSLYQFNTFSTGITYTWRKNDFLTHLIKPLDISITNLAQTTEKFEEFLALNPSIRKSFDEQFIIGASYNFIINKLPPGNEHRYYLNVGVDPSGNLVQLLSKLSKTYRDAPEKKVSILGNTVSQFFRIRTDLRYYFKTGKESILATRFYSGVGLPYGNSDVMPYVKQFYSGGTNSLRAFRARSLGPGSYTPTNDTENVLVDQTGEIKLETNLEYRFPIVGFLKGAVFTDMGNVWLVNADTLRPGGQFHFDTFTNQIAIGLGVGLRIDVSLLVLRFDWAFPVRKPWLPEGERWVFDEINFLDSRWRKNNFLWNISIGYPF